MKDLLTLHRQFRRAMPCKTRPMRCCRADDSSFENDWLEPKRRDIGTTEISPIAPRKTDPHDDKDLSDTDQQLEERTTASEIKLGGPVPRQEPRHTPAPSGDLYVRLEGRIYGPFRPERLELLIASGLLTGLETASANLKKWTPLAYHPRIVRGSIRDIRRVHSALKDMSSLPAKKKKSFNLPPREFGPPRAAILRHPKNESEEF